VHYQPPRALGLLVGSALALWSAGVAYVLFAFALEAGVGVGALLSYTGAAVLTTLAILFGFWTHALATLSYGIDRNGLLITWGPTRQVVPLGDIERLVPGTAVGVPPIRGISWLGHHVGRGEIDRIGEVMFYSTHQGPEQVLYVMTSQRTYAISVEDPHAFAREIQLRQELGPTASVSPHVEREGTAAQPFWEDDRARVMVLGALGACLLLWIYVVQRYASLPPTLTVSFPPGASSGLVSLSGREALFALPRSATAILAINFAVGVVAHASSRVAGYILFGVAGLAQFAMLAGIALALH